MNNLVSLAIIALPGIPLIQPGDDLVPVILAALERAQFTLQDADVLVISSKIISKSEGRLVDLRTIVPSAKACQIAEETDKDPRVVELVLKESAAISRKAPGVLVTQHRLGFVSANAGIDHSNVGESADHVLLLPENPDASARTIRRRLEEITGAKAAVIISDSHGRPFRLGNIGVAIGVAGIPAILDLRGRDDLFGRELQVSMQGYGDLVASAAHLVCGEADEGLPVVLVRGLRFPGTDGQASDLHRPPERDLYR